MSYEHFITWRDQPESLTPFLSVVIPAYNEAERIVPTIASIAAHLTERDYRFEIIVSDDGSTDGTAQLCRELGLRNLIVVDGHGNRGKGAAVRSGVEAANGEFVLFSDADLSTPIEEIDAMIPALLDADVVIGSRAASGATEANKSVSRQAFSRMSRWATAKALGLDVADTQCGFKLFRADAARTLFAAHRVEGFSFDAELLFLAGKFGLTVVEQPVGWVDAPGSTVRPLQVAVRFLMDLLVIRLSWMLGRYDEPTHEAAGSPQGTRIGVVTALPPSKATLTEYGLHLVNNIADLDDVDEVVVFAEDSAGAPSPSRANVHIDAAWTFNSIFSAVRLVRAARRAKPDAVLFNTHFTSFGGSKVPAALGLATPMLMRWCGIPTVVLLHNLVDTTDLDAAGYASRGLERRVLEAIGTFLTRIVLRANHVVTTMPTYVDILRTKYGADNVSLTPHGAFECGDRVGPPQGATRQLLAFGKFGTYKRVDDLIEAFRLLQADGAHDDVELVIAGTDSPVTPGYLASMEAACADLERVRFTGYVAEEDVAGLFSDATLVVFPYTATTGSSGPLHQAGAYSRAVVAPRLGDFIDLVEDEGFAAAPFEPGCAVSLAETMTELLNDPARIAAMGEQNYAAAVGLPLADIAQWHRAHLVQAAR